MGLLSVFNEKKLFVIIQSLLVILFLLFTLIYFVSGASLDESSISSVKPSTQKLQDSLSERNIICSNLTKQNLSSHKEFVLIGKSLFESAYSLDDLKTNTLMSRRILETDLLDLQNKGCDIIVENDSKNILFHFLELLDSIKKTNSKITDLNNNQSFVDLFYLSKGSSEDFLDELLLMKNLSSSIVIQIDSFLSELGGLDNSTNIFLRDYWLINTTKLVDYFAISKNGFEDNINKSNYLLKGLK